MVPFITLSTCGLDSLCLQKLISGGACNHISIIKTYMRTLIQAFANNATLGPKVSWPYFVAQICHQLKNHNVYLQDNSLSSAKRPSSRLSSTYRQNQNGSYSYHTLSQTLLTWLLPFEAHYQEDLKCILTCYAFHLDHYRKYRTKLKEQIQHKETEVLQDTTVCDKFTGRERNLPARRATLTPQLFGQAPCVSL